MVINTNDINDITYGVFFTFAQGAEPGGWPGVAQHPKNPTINIIKYDL